MTDAKARIERLANKRQEQRRQDWQAIKQTDPALASGLTAISAAFGKPEAVQIKLTSGLEINTGGTMSEPPAWDGKLRRVEFNKR